MTGDFHLQFEPDPATSDEAFVKEALGRWNIRVTGLDDYSPAYFFLRDGEKRIRGSLLSYVWGKWLHVDTFWLEDEMRRQGWGTKMLEAAHEIGRTKGAEAACSTRSVGRHGPFTSDSATRPSLKCRTSRWGIRASSW